MQTGRTCNCSPNECLATENYYQDLEEVFRYSIPVGKLLQQTACYTNYDLMITLGKCAGMFAESIQGVGGTVQFTKGYIKKAAALVRKNGGIFISDEVGRWNYRLNEHPRRVQRTFVRFKQGSVELVTTIGVLSPMESYQTL